jgi:aspartyl-tRNA(Asn)/glutamyl-tRNA(Gln) amidotransferase subunit A
MSADLLGTVAELSRALQSRSITSAAVTERCLEQIAGRDPSINAFITVLADQAREQARAADQEIAAGRYRGPLHGVPISLKDLIDLRGTPTSAASRVRRGHVAAHDAVVSTRLRAAGAVFVGKTNLHEFALGTTNEDSAYGPVHHPSIQRDLQADRLAGRRQRSWPTCATPRSAQTPAARSVFQRRRAAWSALSPRSARSHRRRRAVEQHARSCRTALPIGRRRCAPAPGARWHAEPIASQAARSERTSFRHSRGYFFDVLDPEIAARFNEACTRLTTAGAILDDVAIPHAADAPTIYVHIALPEAAAFHATTLESQPEEYTPNVRLRLEMARYILGEDYVRAMRGRDVLIREVNTALHGRDGLLLPTLPVPAVKLGAVNVSIGTAEQPVRAVTLRLTQPFNITGHPAITMPCGRTHDGLPAGAQLVGMETVALLSVASAIEKVLQSS